MQKSQPYFSTIALIVALAGWAVHYSALSFVELSAQGLAAAALILAYIGSLRREHWLAVCTSAAIATALLIITNWIVFLVLLLIPAVKSLKLFFDSDAATESFIGLILVAGAVAVLPAIGIPLLWVIVAIAIVYACFEFIGDLFS